MERGGEWWCDLVTAAVVVGKLDGNPRDGISAGGLCTRNVSFSFRETKQLQHNIRLNCITFCIGPDWTAMLDARDTLDV